MHEQNGTCTRGRIYLEFHRVTWPWRRTLTNGSDVKYVYPWCRPEYLVDGSESQDLLPYVVLHVRQTVGHVDVGLVRGDSQPQAGRERHMLWRHEWAAHVSVLCAVVVAGCALDEDAWHLVCFQSIHHLCKCPVHWKKECSCDAYCELVIIFLGFFSAF